MIDNSVINILIIIENMSYTYDTRVQHIATTLRDFGYHVHIICPRYTNDPSKKSESGICVRYYRIPRFGAGFLGHLLEYAYSFIAISGLALGWHLLKRFKVVHICNPPDIFFPLGRLFQGLNCRFVYDQHDRVPELFRMRYARHGAWVYSLTCRAERLSQSLADHVITTNLSGKRHAVSENHVPEDRISVVRNAPDHDLMPDRIMSDRPRPDRAIRVGYVGNMNAQDGVEFLLYCAYQIKFIEGRSDIRFVMIGDGDAFPGLARLCTHLKLDGMVKFTGRLMPRQAYHCLSRTHICVQPDPKNDFNDTCTMVKTLEYMALGKPVVTFDLRETRYTCGETALYVNTICKREFAEKIITLADNPELRRSLGKQGNIRYRSNLTWSHSQKPLLDAYRSLVKVPDPSGQLAKHIEIQQ